MPITKLQQLIDLLHELRSDTNACAWTQAQTLESLVPQTIEESYELAEAIESDDGKAIQSELADLLYHVLFYANIAEEKYQFTLDDMAATMIEKHQQRLPATEQRSDFDAEQTNDYWEQKKAEKLAQQDSILDGVATTLPAFTRSIKLQNRAARVGFDWPDVTPVFDKIDEEIAEVKAEIDKQAPIEAIEEELGDLLFAATNLARHLNLDPETALRKANRKFTKRFQALEAVVKDEQQDLSKLSLEQMEAIWQRVKRKN